MNAALVSLLALLVAIVVSIVSRVNVGLVAIGLAWLVGVYVAGESAETVIRGFPTSLFVTLTGVTLLFAAATENGTFEVLAHRAVHFGRGNARLMPLVFFLLACAISTIGPGAILSVALIVPLALAVGSRAGVPLFLLALMVANGANAGNLSPVSAVGVIANTKMAEAGLGGHEGAVWLANFAAHLLVGLAAYFLLGGHRLATRELDPAPPLTREPLSRAQRATVAVVLVWIVAVLGFRLNLGLSAFAAAAVLVGIRATDEAAAIRRIPWGVIVMVSGVSVLTALLETTGGMDLFTTLLSRLATTKTVNGVIALVTGAISVYSSTSGVVLPAFLPTAPGLVRELGGGDPLAVSLSINVGASLVDVSPLSTLGALCVAAVPDGPAAARLFRQLLIWGVSMTLVGALLAQLLIGPLVAIATR